MYSQYDEEKYILGAFPEDHVGRFLDIGAWNPTDKSNTRALYELGWSGVMIEPSPGPMLNLLKEYGESTRVVLVQGVVFTEAALIELHVTDDAVSTTSDAEWERWKDTAQFRGKIMVPAVTLADLANRYGGFDFVNIDAEGISADLFLEMLKIGWQPRCVCVEHETKLEMLVSVATPLHYSVVYGNGTNAVFVRG